MNQRIKNIAVAASIIMVLIVVYGFLNRKKKSKKLDELNRLIDNEIGTNGSDFKSILDKIKPDVAFANTKVKNGLTQAQNAALIWYQAFYSNLPLLGYMPAIMPDRTAFKKSLSAKTKAQVKAIVGEFSKKFGVSIDEFLTNNNSEAQVKEYYTILNALK